MNNLDATAKVLGDTVNVGIIKAGAEIANKLAIGLIFIAFAIYIKKK